MSTFTDTAAEFIARQPDLERRRSLWSSFERVGLPSTVDEVWRYAPLGEFRLEEFTVESGPRAVTDRPALEFSTSDATLQVLVDNGFYAGTSQSCPAGVEIVQIETGAGCAGRSFDDRYGADAFALLNGALTPATIEIRVSDGHKLEGPIVIVQRVYGSSAFPSTRIVVERGANVSIVECFVGGAGALVVPLSEYQIGENAELHFATYQRLDLTAWHVARSTAVLERDARMHQSVVGLGGHYNRSRNDAEFVGTGSSNTLHTTFLGSKDQVHDLRTHQLHLVGRTNSLLLSKGAVADHARSVYTGLIEIEKGARRTDARQTNVNLLLSPTAHADTVPNLDIRENDVMCAHASSVGPLDELQRWYLESRGVDRDVAERLLVQGFFREMTESMPPNIAAAVDADVNRTLSATTLVSA